MHFIQSGIVRTCICLAALLLSACATSRSYTTLDLPASNATTQSDKVAFIASVTDSREFQENPRDPSIPSLKKGAAYALDVEGRNAAIARKRNGYGKALGDILLQPPQTVTGIVRQLVAEGLQRKGYRVIDDADSTSSDVLRVDVDIREFWAWLTPGFWTLSMESRINTRLTFNDDSSSALEVAAYGKKNAPTGREGNWHQAFDRAFEDYLQKQQAALDRKFP